MNLVDSSVDALFIRFRVDKQQYHLVEHTLFYIIELNSNHENHHQWYNHRMTIANYRNKFTVKQTNHLVILKQK